MPWPVLADSRLEWSAVYLAGLEEPLVVWLIDRDGTIVYREVGESDASTALAAEAIEATLAAEGR